MRYKVYDEEDKKERTLEECVTPLEVGSVRRVQVIQENKRKCMVGWLKEFDYTKLSYEEAEQVYTLVAGLKNS